MGAGLAPSADAVGGNVGLLLAVALGALVYAGKSGAAVHVGVLSGGDCAGSGVSHYDQRPGAGADECVRRYVISFIGRAG